MRKFTSVIMLATSAMRLRPLFWASSSPVRHNVVRRQLHDELGAHLHLIPFFTHQVVIAQGVKRRTQQQQRQQHHACDKAELLPVDAAEASFWFPSSSLHFKLIANAHTVFSAHWSDTFSTFSAGA